MKNKGKGKILHIFAIFIVIISFVVIYLSFTRTYLTGQIYIDVIPKQPMNNIKGIEEDPIAYVYTTDKSYGNNIYLINQFPISDEVGKNLEGKNKTFDFRLEFNGKTAGVNYEITLEKMAGTDLVEDWVKVYLEEEGKGINCYRTSGRIKTYNEYSKYASSKNEIVLYKGKVTEKDLKAGFRNFRFRMWISEDVKVENNNYESKSFIARVNVHATGEI